MCCCSRCDLSVVLRLEKFVIIQMAWLLKFKHMFDFTSPLQSIPFPFPNSLLMPSDASHFTVMVTTYEPEFFFPISLKHIEVIKIIINRKMDHKYIFQFLALLLILNFSFHSKESGPHSEKVQENCLFEKILEIFVYSFFC